MDMEECDKEQGIINELVKGQMHLVIKGYLGIRSCEVGI